MSKQHDHGDERGGCGRARGPGGLGGADGLLWRAVRAAGTGGAVTLDEVLSDIERAALPGGIDTVPRFVAHAVVGAVHEAWHRGWLPGELLRVARKVQVGRCRD